jgi:uncharacterized membrane protein
MTTAKTDELVQDYLQRLHTALRPLPQSRREQLVSEITEHIEQGRVGAQGHSEAAVRELLDRLGEPEDIAAAALTDEPANVQNGRRIGGLTVAIALIILLAIGVTTAGLMGAFTSGDTGTTFLRLTPTTIQVPLVIGQTASEVTGELRSVGLKSQIVLRPSDSVPMGIISSESPVGGSKVASGSKIQLVESTGPAEQSG